MSDDLIDGDGGGDEGGGTPAWMATFADLSTLLLTFFVLLFTFAEVDVKKFEEALGSIRNSLGVTPASTGVLERMAMKEAPVHEDGQEVPTVKEALEDVESLVSEMVEEQSLQDAVNVEVTSRGVVVQVKGEFFFSPGRADLLDQAGTVLDEIGSIMNSFPYQMAIEGHTDNVPTGGGRFSSNWELSTARAYSALKYLEETKGIDTERMHIAGFAENRPVAENESTDGRAKNRRVEFVFFMHENDPAIGTADGAVDGAANGAAGEPGPAVGDPSGASEAPATGTSGATP